jgi:hypothetical protein
MLNADQSSPTVTPADTLSSFSWGEDVDKASGSRDSEITEDYGEEAESQVAQKTLDVDIV